MSEYRLGYLRVCVNKLGFAAKVMAWSLSALLEN